MFYTVYKIINSINGKFYIGVHKTKNPNDNYYGSGKSIKDAIKKYGIENFSKEILFMGFREKDSYWAEKILIKEYCISKKITYNIHEGGTGGNTGNYEGHKGNKNALGHRWSQEEKKRMSIQRKGHKNNLGKKATEETKKKMSSSQKGLKKPKEWHEKLIERQRTNHNLLKVYLIINPDKEIFELKGQKEIKQFALENNLSPSRLWNCRNKGIIEVIKGGNKLRDIDGSQQRCVGWEVKEKGL